MSGDRSFLDTNLFIYLYSDTDLIKRKKVRETIDQYERYVSTQVLNEFCSVSINKLKMPIETVQAAVAEIMDVCNLSIVNYKTVAAALEYHEKYRYSYYDSLIIASAVESGCQYLLSEDMADGQQIENKLTIRNIFK